VGLARCQEYHARLFVHYGQWQLRTLHRYLAALEGRTPDAASSAEPILRKIGKTAQTAVYALRMASCRMGVEPCACACKWLQKKLMTPVPHCFRAVRAVLPAADSDRSAASPIQQRLAQASRERLATVLPCLSALLSAFPYDVLEGTHPADAEASTEAAPATADAEWASAPESLRQFFEVCAVTPSATPRPGRTAVPPRLEALLATADVRWSRWAVAAADGHAWNLGRWVVVERRVWLAVPLAD